MCFNELQVDLVLQMTKHRLAISKYYRVKVEPVFIDQAELHERGSQPGALYFSRNKVL
jgi:hypothetical protein